MSILSQLTRQNVLDAIAAYDRGERARGFGEATGYDLVFNNRLYPPKHVLALAASIAFNRQIDSTELHGRGGQQSAASLRALEFTVRQRDERLFDVGKRYTRERIQELLGLVPERGGNWFTGYHRHNDEWYVFANVQSAGRTGQNYGNRWIGDELHWSGRTGSRLNHASIQSLIGDTIVVHMFTREHDRDEWQYEGQAMAVNVRDTDPVEVLWRFDNPRDLRDERLPEQVPQLRTYTEGAVNKVTVNAYERNPAARRACIRHWGTDCVVCGMSFLKNYGEIGRDFIHVHHLREISEVGQQYEVDPIEDLRPVCPNCHAMLHRSSPMLTIDELQALLRTSA